MVTLHRFLTTHDYIQPMLIVLQFFEIFNLITDQLVRRDSLIFVKKYQSVISLTRCNLNVHIYHGILGGPNGIQKPIKFTKFQQELFLQLIIESQ